MKSTIKQAIGSFVVFQLGLTLLVSALFWGFLDLDSARSALLGGMIQVIASTYFAFRCFRYHGAKQARQIVRAFYQGEAFKIILVMIMMVVVFTCLTVKALPFFLTFIAVQLTSWLLPQFFNKV